MLKLLGQETSKVSAMWKISEEVSFRGIAFHFSGLNTATAVLVEELGRLKYRIRGKSMVDMDMQYLIAFDKLKGGFPHLTSTASGLLDIFVYLPRFFVGKNAGADNVELLTKEDNAEIEIVYGAGLAATSNPTTFVASVFLDLDDWLCAYSPTFHQIAESVAASVLLTKQYEDENMLSVCIADVVSSQVTSVGGNWFGTTHANQGRLDFTVGHKTVNGHMNAWRAYSDFINQIEAVQTAPCCIEVFNTFGDEVENKLFDSIGMNILNGSGGAATPQILVVGAKLNDYKLEESSVRTQALFQQRINAKSLAGHTGAVNVLSKLVGG